MINKKKENFNIRIIFYMHSALFITDFDRTLLRNDKTIGKKDLQAMEELGRKGVLRAIATGRSLYSFERALDELGFSKQNPVFPVDYVIFSTGAGIMDYKTKTIIKNESLKPWETAHIADYFENQKLDYMIHRPIPHTRNFVFKSHGAPNPDFSARIQLYNQFCSPLNGNDAHCFGRATEVLSIIPKCKARNIDRKIKKALSSFSVIKATSPLDHESVWIEVFPRSVSKSRAGSWLAEKLQINRKNIVSIGNDYNDADLLTWSGKGFVVENAPNDLKLKFETVASNNKNGVARAIDRGFR